MGTILNEFKASAANIEIPLESVQLELWPDMCYKVASFFTECQDHHKASGDRLVQAEVNLVELRTCLAMVNEARTAANVELETANAKRESAELQLFAVEGEIKTSLSKSGCLEEESETEGFVGGSCGQVSEFGR